MISLLISTDVIHYTNQTFNSYYLEMEKSEFYVKTLLSLFKADMLPLNRLSELVEAEV